MINKNKIRVIGDVVDFYNGPDVLDLRKIARAKEEAEKRIRERDLVNLKVASTNDQITSEIETKKQEHHLASDHSKNDKKAIIEKQDAESRSIDEAKILVEDEKVKKLANLKQAVKKEKPKKSAFLLFKENWRRKKELKKQKLAEAKKILLAKQAYEIRLNNDRLLAIRKAKEERRLLKQKTRRERLIMQQREKLALRMKLEELKIKKRAEKQRLQAAKKERRKIFWQKLAERQKIKRREKINSLVLLRGKLSKGFQFSLVGFVVVCVVLMSGIKGLDFFNSQAKNTKSKILSDALVAYQYMGSATNSVTSKDFEMANYKFGVATDRFLNAQKDLNQYGEVLTSVLKIMPGGSQVRSGDSLLSAGANLSKAGEYMTLAVVPLKDFGSFISLPGSKQDNKKSLTEILSLSVNSLNLAVGKLDQANLDLKNVKISDLPSDVGPKIAVVKENLPKISEDLKNVIGYSDKVLEILGHKGNKRYLVLFQNNRELRPTGGFMGTYALVDMDAGGIKNIKIEGPYNLDGNLMEKIIAPEPLRLIQVKFFLRDSNWFLDFPMSAKKIMSMYEKSGGPTVDGVFTVNANVMQALLNVTGEIDMPAYNTKVNSENFFDETQWKVEYDYDKEENEPKKFLADLFPIFLDRLSNLNKDKLLEAFNVMYKMLDQKEIMMYFNDEKLENFAKGFNWTGEIKETSKDFLSVVITNIGGGKTDNVIDQKILHEVEIEEDGSVVDTVTITRMHNGDPNNFWTSIKNMAYMRIYVPLGSEMLEAKGFDREFWGVIRPLEDGSIPDPLISDIESNMRVNNENGIRIMREDGKTVFGNWMGVECGQIKTAMIKYRLPFKVKGDATDLAASYSLFLQKQSGTNPFEVTSILKYPKNYYVNWKYTSDNLFTEVADGLQYSTKLNKDKAYAVVFVK